MTSPEVHEPRVRNTFWPVGFRIRPATDPASAHVEVVDIVTGRRHTPAPDELARQILTGEEAAPLPKYADTWRRAREGADGRAALVPSWQHWQTRAWHPSDQFYVASRHATSAGVPPAPTASAEVAPIGPVVPLGTPAPLGTQSVSQLLVKRRSGRAYVPKPVPVERLSGLLWHGLAEVRAARSSTDGADTPGGGRPDYGTAWDVYLCLYHVDGVEPGTYRYDLAAHELHLVRPGDHRTAMIDVLQGMHSPATAAWTLGLVADFPRYQPAHPGEHGLRRLYLESGILAQELILLGMGYGLSTLVTPAQKDSAYLELHGLSADRFAPVYTLTMGFSRGADGVYFNGLRPPAPAGSGS